MENRLLEALYDRIDDYFDRNREWFNEYFFLLEKFDRESNEFYYIGLDKLFLNRNEEIGEVLDFFNCDKAKGNINDTAHHTSGIYRKFNNNNLTINDFKLKSLGTYFDKHQDTRDEFVFYKRKLLFLKICECDYKSASYFSFPLIALNELHGSVHIIFHSDDLDTATLRLEAMFRNTVTIFTEYFENILFESGEVKNLNDLSIQSMGNSFLRGLDYPKFYLSRSVCGNTQPIQEKETISQNESDFIQELVTKGETFNALNLLEGYTLSLNKEMLLEILTMKANLAWLNKEKFTNTISNEEFRRELSRLNYSILKLNQDLKIRV